MRALQSPTHEATLVWWATWPVLLMSGVAGGVLALTAEPLASILTAGQSSQDLARAIGLAAPFVALAPALGVLHTAIRMMRGVTTFTVLQNILIPLGRVAAVGLVALLGWDVVGAFGAWLALLPLWVVLALGVLVKPLLTDLRTSRADAPGELETFRSFWRFSGGRAIGAAVEVCLEWADVIIVAALRPPAEVGLYAVVTRTVRPGQIVDRALRIVVSPLIARQLALDERTSAAELHTNATRALVLLSWPFYVSLIVMGPAVLSMFGPDFVEGHVLLVVMAATFMLAALGGMLQSILLMGGRSSWQVYEKSAVLVLSVTLNFLLVPRLGVLGAAIAFAVVVSLDTVAAGVIVHRWIGVDLRPWRVVPVGLLPVLVFGGGGILVSSAWGTSPAALLPFLGISLPIYAICLWVMRKRLGIAAIAGRGHPEPAAEATDSLQSTQSNSLTDGDRGD